MITSFAERHDRGLYHLTTTRPRAASGWIGVCSRDGADPLNRMKQFAGTMPANDPDAIVRWSLAQADAGREAFVGMGLMADRPLGGRGKGENVTVLNCFYLDIDIGNFGHADKKLPNPPTIEAAMELLAQFPT